jgi:hypothetical protein
LIDHDQYLAELIDLCQYRFWSMGRDAGHEGCLMTTMLPVEAPITGPDAWAGEDLARSSEWVRSIRERGLVLEDIGREQFPLPGLAPVIAGWAEQLDAGRGFVLARGLPVEEWGEADAAIAYWGIGQHLGLPVSQNTDGDLLGHVRDVGADPADPSVRLYKTRAAQPFHTDGSDAVGLLCLQTARRGGASSIVSSVSVFNEVARRRPDLVGLMFQPFPFDLYEQQAEGQQPYMNIPIATYFGGRLFTMYIRFYIDQAQRHAEVPRLTDAQRELLDLIDEIAASPRLRLDMEFRPGDMQFLSNRGILHGRTEYEDDPDHPRHLLRLWLTLHRHVVDGEGIGAIPTKEQS